MARRLKNEKIEDIIALDDMVIVEAHDTANVTDGGIHIPDKAKQKSFRGTVVAVGPGKWNDHGTRNHVNVEVGDVILYRNFLGWRIGEWKDAKSNKEYYAISSDERIARIPKARVEYCSE